MSFTTFGEIMLRLTPELHAGKIISSKTFDVNFAGSESNVASALSILGNQVDFVTKLPKNPLGDAAINSLRSYGVCTKNIIRGGKRIGTYFIEIGASIRPSQVIYDRLNASISAISANEFCWETIFKNKKWVFISGITPSLSKTCAEETIKLVKTAKKMGVNVSFDMNYRRKLWREKKEARKLFDSIIEHTDLLFGNSGVLNDVYNITSNQKNYIDNTIDCIEVAKQKFGVQHLAFTARNHTSASINSVSGVWLSNSNPIISNAYTVTVLDRFGAGDAFASGCLHAINKSWSNKKIINFATASFALKHTMYGDQFTSTENEINAILEGNISGHVIR